MFPCKKDNLKLNETLRYINPISTFRDGVCPLIIKQDFNPFIAPSIYSLYYLYVNKKFLHHPVLAAPATTVYLFCPFIGFIPIVNLLVSMM